MSEKVAFEGTVVKVSTFTRTPYYARGWRPTSWGYPPAETVKVLKFVDTAGKNYVWFTTGAVAGGVALKTLEGAKVTVKGTFKKVGEWNGVEETHLTRCKVAVTEPAPVSEEEGENAGDFDYGAEYGGTAEVA